MRRTTRRLMQALKPVKPDAGSSRLAERLALFAAGLTTGWATAALVGCL